MIVDPQSSAYGASMSIKNKNSSMKDPIVAAASEESAKTDSRGILSSNDSLRE